MFSQGPLFGSQAAPPVAVVHTLYQDQQPAQWLVRQLGEGKTTLLALPSTVTDDGASATLDGWMDSLIAALLTDAGIGGVDWHAALDEMEEGEQTRRDIKEQRWNLEEERRRNLLNERRIRKLEDELRRLKGGRLSG